MRGRTTRAVGGVATARRQHDPVSDGTPRIKMTFQTRVIYGLRAMAYGQSWMPAPAMNGHFNARIHQATGMISVQLDCNLVDAMTRLRLRATEMGQSLEATAGGVIDGAIRFDQSP